MHGFDQVHLAAEPGKGLRQLASDRAGADHPNPFGQIGERKHRLVGQVARLFQPWSRRRGGAGARADRRFLEAQGPVTGPARHLDGLRPGEAPLADEHIHTQFRVAMRRVRVADAGSQLAHPGHRCGKVVLHVWRDVDAEFVRMPHIRPGARGANDTLRRHASHIQTIAAHQMLLDQRHLGPQGR